MNRFPDWNGEDVENETAVELSKERHAVVQHVLSVARGYVMAVTDRPFGSS
jgi:hypothetical protein